MAQGLKKVEKIVSNIAKLGAWLKKFRPGSKTISVSHDDMQTLLRYPDIARQQGVTIMHDGKALWGGIELVALPPPAPKRVQRNWTR
jgi:hypothetical protein